MVKALYTFLTIHLFFLPTLLGGFFFPGHDLEAASKKANTKSERKKGNQIGRATFYGKGFHGEETACGEIFNKHEMVAAHPSFPFGTIVRVTNLENKHHVDVRIIDRGPAKAPRIKGVIIDLSRAAAEVLRIVKKGHAKVRLEVLEWGGRPRVDRRLTRQSISAPEESSQNDEQPRSR